MAKKTARRSTKRARPSDPVAATPVVETPFLKGEGTSAPADGTEVLPAGDPPTNETAPAVVDLRPGPITVVHKPDEMLGVIERLAKDPEFDVTKMQALIDMRDTSIDKQRARDLEDEARAAAREFAAAFIPLQADLPVVTEKGEIWDKQHTKVVATYAKWEDINEVLKPILSAHGFGLDFETLNVEKNQLQTLGFLRHVGGHVRQSQFTGAPDESGFKNATQGIGSVRSYGKRYCAQDLLNLTSRGEDDDARAAHTPEPPEGYEAWEHVFMGLASQGIQKLQSAWNETKQNTPDFCDYCTKYRSDQLAGWKDDAKAATQKLLHQHNREVDAQHQREPGEEG